MKKIFTILILALFLFGCKEDELYSTEFCHIPHSFEDDVFETIAAYDTHIVVYSTNYKNRKFNMQIGYRNDKQLFTDNYYVFTGNHMIINLETQFDYVWIVGVSEVVN